MAKVTFVKRAQTVAVSVMDEAIELPVLQSNLLVCYDRITAQDATNDVTRVEIGLRSGASEYILDGRAAPGVGVPFSVAGKVFANGLYRPFARFVGATAGDQLSLAAFGYITDNPE